VKSGRLRNEVRVMAVTKMVDAERIRAALDCGISLVGDNRVQEFQQRAGDYPDSCEVHFIGGLQSNKVRAIVDSEVTTIQSVGTVKLAREINRVAGELSRVMDVLIQVNIGREESKGGVLPEQLDELAGQVVQLPNLRLRGLMAIPPYGNSELYFEKMQRLFENLRGSKAGGSCGIDTLSMGMSSDFTTAIEYGATVVRLGSVLFGNR